MADALADFYVRGSLLFLAVGLVVLFVDLWRDDTRSKSVDARSEAENLTLEELALLSKGAMGLALLAVLELIREGDVVVKGGGRLEPTVYRRTIDGSPFERTAFTAVQRAGRSADLHDVRDAVRRLYETRTLLDGLADRGLVRPSGVRRQCAPDGEESWFHAVARVFILAGVIFAPVTLLSLLAGDDWNRSWEGDPGAQVAVATGAMLFAGTCWLMRLRTAAGRAVLLRVSDGGDELRAVAIGGVRAVADDRTRRRLKASLSTRYEGGGG